MYLHVRRTIRTEQLTRIISRMMKPSESTGDGETSCQMLALPPFPGRKRRAQLEPPIRL
jgi:hypothetical protein